MSGAGGRPTKAQAVVRAGELLDAAREIFCQRGFASATIEEIAAALGWSKHTVYKRHSSKIDLLEAVVERDVERFIAALEEARSSGEGGLEPLRAMARAYFGFSASPGYSALYAAVALEAATSDRLRQRLSGWAARSLAPLREEIVSAAGACGWRVEDAEDTCAVLIDLLDGEANRVKWSGNAANAHEIDARFARRWQLFQLTARGLRARDGDG